jgi:hypothetical protein
VVETMRLNTPPPVTFPCCRRGGTQKLAHPSEPCLSTRPAPSNVNASGASEIPTWGGGPGEGTHARRRAQALTPRRVPGLFARGATMTPRPQDWMLYAWGARLLPDGRYDANIDTLRAVKLRNSSLMWVIELQAQGFH